MLLPFLSPAITDAETFAKPRKYNKLFNLTPTSLRTPSSDSGRAKHEVMMVAKMAKSETGPCKFPSFFYESAALQKTTEDSTSGQSKCTKRNTFFHYYTKQPEKTSKGREYKHICRARVSRLGFVRRGSMEKMTIPAAFSSVSTVCQDVPHAERCASHG